MRHRKLPRFLSNPMEVWILNEVARTYGQRPSTLMAEGWLNYVLDRGVQQTAVKITNEYEKTDKNGKRVHKTVGDAIKALKPKTFETTDQAIMALMAAFGGEIDMG